jgi:hypothetical protein
MKNYLTPNTPLYVQKLINNVLKRGTGTSVCVLNLPTMKFNKFDEAKEHYTKVANELELEDIKEVLEVRFI